MNVQAIMENQNNNKLIFFILSKQISLQEEKQDNKRNI